MFDYTFRLFLCLWVKLVLLPEWSLTWSWNLFFLPPNVVLSLKFTVQLIFMQMHLNINHLTFNSLLVEINLVVINFLLRSKHKLHTFLLLLFFLFVILASFFLMDLPIYVILRSFFVDQAIYWISMLVLLLIWTFHVVSGVAWQANTGTFSIGGRR